MKKTTSYLKLNASKRSKLWLISFLLTFLLSSQIILAQTEEKAIGGGPTTWIQISLTQIGTFTDFQSLQSTLMRMEGNEKVQITSEAADLITLQVKTNLSTKDMIDKLNEIHIEKHSISERKIPKGSEIVIKPKS